MMRASKGTIMPASTKMKRALLPLNRILAIAKAIIASMATVSTVVTTDTMVELRSQRAMPVLLKA